MPAGSGQEQDISISAGAGKRPFSRFVTISITFFESLPCKSSTKEPICALHCCLIAFHLGVASGRMEMARRYRCEPLTREVTFPGSICRLMTEPLRTYVRPRGSRTYVRNGSDINLQI